MAAGYVFVELKLDFLVAVPKMGRSYCISFFPLRSPGVHGCIGEPEERSERVYLFIF